ncbi:unnamed protein product, partial [Medioppia subpectinata]
SCLKLYQSLHVNRHHFVSRQLSSAATAGQTAAIAAITTTAADNTEPIGDRITRQYVPMTADTFIRAKDPVTRRQIEMILREYEWTKGLTGRVPTHLTDEQMDELLPMSETSHRQQYLKFLYTKEGYKLKGLVRKRVSAARSEAAKGQPSLRPRPVLGVWHESRPAELVYGYNRNSLSQRIKTSVVKRLYNHRLKTAALFGQKVVIDLDFDKYMSRVESRQLLKQLQFLYNYNKYESGGEPFDLHFVNCTADGILMKDITLYIPNALSDSYITFHYNKSYTDVFPREQLVYLSPHSDTTLDVVSDDDIYIIGGLIDKSYTAPISAIKAREDGIRSARLPIRGNLEWRRGSQHLCINQVLAILREWQLTRDWPESLRRHIPIRKWMSDEDYDHMKDDIIDRYNPLKYKFNAWTIITAEDKQLFNHLIQTLSQFTDKTSLEEEIQRSNEIVVKPVVENTNKIKSPSVVRRSDETITTFCEEKTIKTSKTIIETNVRRSGRTDRKVYTCVLKTQRDPNHVPKPKPERKVYAIPDPESDPNSLLLLRRDNYDLKTQQFMCPNPHCRKGYRSAMRLYKHFHTVHHMKKKIVCQKLNCGKSFKTTQELKSHENNVHSDYRPFECSQKGCDFKFKTEAQLNSHSVIHSDIYAFKCNECEKTFKTQYNLNIHLRIHSKEDTFRCRYEGCNQWFKSALRLIKHKICVHNARQKWYPCEWPACGYRTKSSSSLKNHRRIHTGERPFECRWPACDKRFAMFQTRKDHERIHSNTKNYVCHWPGCGYRCVQTSNLKKHMKTIITAEDKQLFNHLIQTLSQFTDKTSLVEEISRSDEIVVKPVVENTIGIKSPSVVRRNDETITTSSEEKTIKTNETTIETNVRRSGRTDRKVYTCVLKTTKDPNHVPKPKPEPKTQQFMCPNPHCRKGYRNAMRLYKHFHNVHHMKKTFICHELNCGKSFKTKKELQSHENNIHENSDYRPFECPEKGCDFKCKTESILNSHSVIHSDIHSFKCNECEKTFKTQYRLNFHLKLHGNEDNFK